jgi:hypothetical protein
MPGVDRANLRRALSDVHVSVLNIRGAGVGEYPFDRVVVYLNWVNDAVRMLRKQISSADIDRLVLTRRYELLLAEDISSGSRVLNGLLSAELDERADAFDEAREALEREIKRWSRPGMLVVADTSVYITNPDKLEELDFASLINVREGRFPVVVAN